jgi:hypothetical protein
MSITLHHTNLENLRERLRRMSDLELIRYGKAARSLCQDPRGREEFEVQLKEARAEWRRRHPKTV